MDANKELEAILELDIVPVQEISNHQTDEAHIDSDMHQKAFTTTTVFVNKAKLYTVDFRKRY